MVGNDDAAENKHDEGHNKNDEPVFDVGGGKFDGSADVNDGIIDDPDADDDAKKIGDFVASEKKGNANDDGNYAPKKIIVEEIFVAFGDEINNYLIKTADNEEDGSDIGNNHGRSIWHGDKKNTKHYENKGLNNREPSGTFEIFANFFKWG